MSSHWMIKTAIMLDGKPIEVWQCQECEQLEEFDSGAVIRGDPRHETGHGVRLKPQTFDNTK